jgi:hypothetical protein
MSTKPKQRRALTFAKIRPVKSPDRGHPTDAGLDFFIPDDAFEGKYHDLMPGEQILIAFWSRSNFLQQGWSCS